MNIKPLGNKVVVKPTEVEEATASGIFLPETAEQEKKMEGEILAIGSGRELAEFGLIVGQKVLFRKWGGEEVEVDKEKYKILDHTDLVAIIE